MDPHRCFRVLVAAGLAKAEHELQRAQRQWPPDGARITRARDQLRLLEAIGEKLLRASHPG